MRKNVHEPTYHSWINMRQRCTNSTCPKYKNYGARGIVVCQRWSNFINFLADMGERPPNTTLDRIDNDGNYELGNCRWGTPTQQARNQRVPYTSKSGVRGVRWCRKTQRWRASIRVGSYKKCRKFEKFCLTLETAIVARKELEYKYWEV